MKNRNVLHARQSLLRRVLSLTGARTRMLTLIVSADVGTISTITA